MTPSPINADGSHQPQCLAVRPQAKPANVCVAKSYSSDYSSYRRLYPGFPIETFSYSEDSKNEHFQDAVLGGMSTYESSKTQSLRIDDCLILVHPAES